MWQRLQLSPATGERMTGCPLFAVIGSRVFAWRAIAAAGVPAALAHPPLHPRRQALFAAMDLGRDLAKPDGVRMSAAGERPVTLAYFPRKNPKTSKRPR